MQSIEDDEESEEEELSAEERCCFNKIENPYEVEEE
jgi:hypothetical protein